jgi:hypothetical protein
MRAKKTKFWSETQRKREKFTYLRTQEEANNIKKHLTNFTSNNVDWILLARGRFGGISWRQRVFGFSEVWSASWQIRQPLISHASLCFMHLVAKLLINNLTVSVTTWFHISALRECRNAIISPQFKYYILKGKAIPLLAWTGPDGSRRLRFPDFKTIGTWRW